jgi:hypothetical protein
MVVQREMKHKLILPLLLVSFTVFLSIAYRLPSSKAELRWGTTYTISVHIDSSAQWTYERKTLIENETDMLEWWDETFDDKRLAFQDQMEAIVNQARQTTGRNMSITPVTAIYERTETMGIITYQFDWHGFAKIENKTIEIGDAFNNQSIDLDQDALLIIQYPEGYTSSEATPPPMGVSLYDRTISWKGPVNFGDEEPRVILIQGTAQSFNPWQAYAPVAVGATSISALSLTLWYIFHSRRGRIGNLAQTPVLGVEDDEQKVTAMLQRTGGSTLQSNITREFGFSKAKTSQLLDTMEKKGTVTRQKKGREKIVTLKQQDKKPQKN